MSKQEFLEDKKKFSEKGGSIMKKSTKIWLIIATSLVVLGCIMFSVVMTKKHWDFTKLSTVNYETNTYQISEKFSSISMNSDTADILMEAQAIFL